SSLKTSAFAKAAVAGPHPKSTCNNKRLLLVDFGCGPATAALAMAEVFNDDMFDYVGLDRSLAMRTMGQRIWKAAVRGTLIGPQARANFLPSWDSFPMNLTDKDTRVL